MKIETSAIAMASKHQYNSFVQQSVASMITTEEQAATLDFSEEGATMVEQMKEEQAKLAREKEQERKENTAKMFSQQMQQVKRQSRENMDMQDEMQLKMELLRKMFKAMFELGIEKKGADIQELNRLKAQYQSVGVQKSFCVSAGATMINGAGAGEQVGGATAWKKTTVTSAFVTETENTAYEATGIVKTADGTELFGTESGDGFKDLAAYDKEKNGWIDENDSVFGELKIWTKDPDGNDKLLDLKETGEVSTIQHVDLAL